MTFSKILFTFEHKILETPEPLNDLFEEFKIVPTN